MSLIAQLDAAKSAAMHDKANAATSAVREQADARLSVVRMMLGAISEAETAGRERVTLTDEQVASLLKKEAAKRRATAEVYEQAGSEARAEQELWEADYIGSFLPKDADPAEVEAFIVRYIAETDLPSGGAAIGAVLKALKEQFGSLDTRAASAKIRELL